MKERTKSGEESREEQHVQMILSFKESSFLEDFLL
ncbi:hypothetical protein LI7559_00330 [Bacillus licheniformis LMG 7559]|nr:hypothetical protein LI7559_00330 [Bacillus licheniformis LMG 7559]